MWFAKTIKNLKLMDVTLIKLSVLFFAFFIASYINSEIITSWRWIWFVLGALFAIKPVSIALKHM